MHRKTPKKIYFIGFIKGLTIGFVLGELFYRNVIISLVAGVIAAVFMLFVEEKEYRRKQESQMTLEFREGLQGISSALGAGYSIENAISEACDDLILLYGDSSILAVEFEWIENQLKLSRNIEDLFFELAERWNTEDVKHFAEVFQTAKRTGGDLIAITHSTAEKISAKIEVQREIQTMIAGKRLEGTIMNIIPLGMIVYFWLCSPGFLDPLYMGAGRLVMSALLGTYIAAFLWSRKICDISV